MSAYLPRRRAERRGLRLWPVGTVLALTFTAAVVVAAAVFYTGWDLLDARGLKAERRLDSQTLFDLVKLSFGVVAGAGALVALVVAYRRQRLDEDGALREATRLHTERFTAAVTQLGDDSAAVRLGGVHALAGLADDAPTRGLRQTCIDVLCAYLRLPYTAKADLPDDDAPARHAYLALREVRHTIIRLIRDHLRLEADHAHSWQGHDFDLTEVVFDGGDLSHAIFSEGTVDFRGATFSEGTVDFRRARFSGSTIYFSEAQFSGGSVDFREAEYLLQRGAVLRRQGRLHRNAVLRRQRRLPWGDVLRRHDLLLRDAVFRRQGRLPQSTVLRRHGRLQQSGRLGQSVPCRQPRRLRQRDGCSAGWPSSVRRDGSALWAEPADCVVSGRGCGLGQPMAPVACLDGRRFRPRCRRLRSRLSGVPRVLVQVNAV